MVKGAAVGLARTCIAVLCMTLLTFASAVTAEPVKPAGEDWLFAAEIYAWLPTIENTDKNGNKTKITLDDILKNLDFTAMAVAGARKGKWSILADVVYMDLSKNSDEYRTQRIRVKEIQLESWVVSPTVGYTVYADDRHVIDVFAGARYLWVEAGTDIRLEIADESRTRNVSDSGSVWDGIVGVRGVNRYSPKWSSIYSLSGGAGDSKYTWQANVSLAYKFDTVSAAVGWQYLTWDFENDAPLQDMTINGPYVGAIFHF